MMDEQTQMAQPGEQQTSEKESSVPNNTLPVAHLRVFLQKSEDDVEEIDYPIMEGETTIGRGEDCGVVICAHSLSRQHAQILVEEGSHFIQDLSSRNKTFRQMTTLRPKVYYELTDGCELTFSNVSCQYHYSLPSEVSFDTEETQAYLVDDGEAAKDESKEDLEATKEDVEEEADSDTSTVCVEDGGDGDGGDGGEGGLDGDDAEPTQAYDLHSPMDCDPTVAYDLAGGVEKLEDSGDENNESTSSSPLLVGAPKHLQTTDDVETAKDAPARDATKRKVNFAVSEPESEKTRTTGKTSQSSSEPQDGDDETDTESEKVEEANSKEEGVKATPGLERANTEYMETDFPTVTGNVDHTVLYDLETDEESGTGDRDKNEGAKPTPPPAIEPTAPYHLDEEDTDSTDLEGEPENKSSKEATDTANKSTVVDDAYTLKTATDKNIDKEKQKTTSTSTSDDVDGESERKQLRGSPSTGPEIVVEPSMPYVVDSGRQEEHDTNAKITSEDQTHLKVTQNKKTLSNVSLMDYSEQGRPTLTLAGPGTLILDSYEESCEPTHGERDVIPLAKGTTVVLESYQSTCPNTVPVGEDPLGEDENILKGDATLPLESYKSSSEEDRALANKERDEHVSSSSKGAQREDQLKDKVQPKLETNDQAASSDDDLSSLIPDTKSVNMSKQKTIFLSALGGRGKRGRAKKGTRGRGRKNTRTQLVEAATPITGAREDTDIPGGSDSEAVSTKGSEGQTENESASNIEQKTADRLLRNESNKATGTKRKSARNTHHLPTLESVISMDVDVTDSPSIVSGNNTETDSITEEQDKPDKGQKVRGGRSSTRRGRGRGGGGSRKVKTEASPKPGTDGVTQSLAKDESVYPMSVADVMSGDLLEESPDLPVTATPKDEGSSSGEKTPSDEYTSTQSASSDGTASVNSSKGGRGKRGRGRGKRTSTPRRGKTIKTEAPATPSPRVRRTPTSSACKVSTSEEGEEKPQVMFTGLIDKTGEKTVQELGGELVDSVYLCTHLVTDKVRRTLKFLCCLSRGCLIVNDNWLGECAQAGCFLPAEPFLIKDRIAERQHNFSLKRSHDCSKLSKVMADYKVYLTPNIKPQREQMADIIKCSGGDPLDFLSPVPPGEKTVIVTCDDDLSMCKEASEAGIPVCSTEFILGGVLKQELDVNSHLMSIPNEESRGGGRKRRAKEPPAVPAAKRRRK